MATSRISTNTILTSSKNERRQVEARIRALQQRTNALHEELSRSSSVATNAIHNIERTYMNIINEFQEQRDQLLRRIHHAKQNIRQSTNELNGIRKYLQTTQSYHMPQTSPRYSTDIEIQEMKAMVNDIERALSNITQQMKQYRFKPAQGHAMNKTLGSIQTGKISHQNETSLSSIINSYNSYEKFSVAKIYTIDLDITADWIVASIDDRIYLCDHEGEIRIYSYSNRLRRQPLITEHFHLSTIRLISSFTATYDYLIAFETDTQMLSLHSHHGALLARLSFPYDPLMVVRSIYSRKNEIWSCSRSKRQCHLFNLQQNMKEFKALEQLDFKHPISDIVVDPVGISTDENGQIAVHDVNQATSDRLLIFTDHHNMIIPLDLVKYSDRQLTSRIDRVLLFPKHPNLIVLIYAPQSNSSTLREIVLLDVESQPTQILYRISEPYGIRNVDITMNGEIIYSVTPPTNKRITPKLHIYSFIH